MSEQCPRCGGYGGFGCYECIPKLDRVSKLDRVRREARNEALEEALQLIPNYHDDHWIESLRAPHFKRVLAVLDRSIRAMMEDDDT